MGGTVIGRFLRSKGTVVITPNTWGRVGRHLRFRFAAGMLFMVPLILTYWVMRLVFDFLDGLLSPAFDLWFRREIPGVGLVALVMVVYVSGIVATSVFGLRLISRLQQLLLSVPVIRPIYSAIKRLVESFSGSPVTGFKRVVAIEYPRPGLWTIGFLTSLTIDEEDRPMAVVYIPTAPLPNSGWVAMLSIEDVYDTDMTVQAAMQMVLSGGIVTPGRITKQLLSDTSIITAEEAPSPEPGSNDFIKNG